MLEWIESTTLALGYPGIALLMFIECVFPPLPSELILPLAGFTAAQGHLSLVGVVLAGTVGSLFGQLPYYFLGRLFGLKTLQRWADRYGYLLTLSSRDLERATVWFDRYGIWAVLVGRLIPGLRSLIPIPAGIARMPLLLFLLYSAFGTAAWSFLLTLLGFILRQNYHLVGRYLALIVGVLVVIVAGFALGLLLQRHLARRRTTRG